MLKYFSCIFSFKIECKYTVNLISALGCNAPDIRIDNTTY